VCAVAAFGASALAVKVDAFACGEEQDVLLKNFVAVDADRRFNAVADESQIMNAFIANKFCTALKSRAIKMRANILEREIHIAVSTKAKLKRYSPTKHYLSKVGKKSMFFCHKNKEKQCFWMYEKTSMAGIGIAQGFAYHRGFVL